MSGFWAIASSTWVWFVTNRQGFCCVFWIT